MTQNNNFFDSDALYAGVRQAVGRALEDPIPAWMGYIDELGATHLKVPPTSADVLGKYYFTFAYSNDLSEASSFGMAYNTGPTILDDRYLGFGAPVYVARDRGSAEWYIVGLRPRQAAGFIGEQPRPDPVLPGAVNTQTGLLDRTDPESMRCLVFSSWYTLDRTIKFIDTLYVDDQTAAIPTVDGQAVYASVQMDWFAETLVVAYGVSFDAVLTHEQAWLADGGAALIFPEAASGCFLAGYIKLVSGMTSITRQSIWAAQEIISRTEYRNIITAADEVVTSDGEVVFL